MIYVVQMKRLVRLLAFLIMVPVASTTCWACSLREAADVKIRSCTELLSGRRTSAAAQANAYVLRGSAYIEKGMLDDAIADFDAALQRRPRSHHALDGRAWALNLKGEYAKAKRDLDEAIRIEPSYFYAYNNRGWSHNGLGEYLNAIADFNEAERRRPSFSYVFGNRAFSYRQLGRFPEAAADITRLINLYPDTASFYQDRANVYIAARNYGAAISDIQSALRLTRDKFERQSLEATLAEVRQPIDRPFQPPPPPLPPAQEPQGYGRRIALVIGNTAYSAAGFLQLENPERDATAIAAALERIGFGGNVTLLANKGFREIRDALARFERAAEGADWAVIYYAGHGVEIAGGNYLVPVDAEIKHPDDVVAEAIPLSYLLRAVRGARVTRFVALDACRTNPEVDRIGGVSNGLGDVDALYDTYILYAARRGTTASDGPPGGNSPFARAMLRYLGVYDLKLNALGRNVRDYVRGETQGTQIPFPYGFPPDVSFRPSAIR